MSAKDSVVDIVSLINKEVIDKGLVDSLEIDKVIVKSSGAYSYNDKDQYTITIVITDK